MADCKQSSCDYVQIQFKELSFQKNQPIKRNAAATAFPAFEGNLE